MRWNFFLCDGNLSQRWKLLKKDNLLNSSKTSHIQFFQVVYHITPKLILPKFKEMSLGILL